MGRRSNFARVDRDAYATIDPRAYPPLLPHLRGVKTFAEPCAGDGHMVRALEAHGLICQWSSDIVEGVDALDVTNFGMVDAIISNPPWRRKLLHPMLQHFQRIAPTWLLFDAAWAFTKQSAPFMDQCSHIVAVGRLRWIPDTTMSGKDDCSWYRFHAQHVGGPKFIGREAVAA